MLLIKTASLSLLAIFLFSCASQQPKPVVVNPPFGPVQTQARVSQSPENPDHPAWIDDPRLVGHIVVIGSAATQPYGGDQAQYMSAMEDAQTKLTIEFKKHQQALIALENKYPSSDTELNHQIKELVLQNAIIKQEWRDPMTNRLYLWLVLPSF